MILKLNLAIDHAHRNKMISKREANRLKNNVYKIIGYENDNYTLQRDHDWGKRNQLWNYSKRN